MMKYRLSLYTNFFEFLNFKKADSEVKSSLTSFSLIHALFSPLSFFIDIYNNHLKIILCYFIYRRHYLVWCEFKYYVYGASLSLSNTIVLTYMCIRLRLVMQI